MTGRRPLGYLLLPRWIKAALPPLKRGAAQVITIQTECPQDRGGGRPLERWAVGLGLACVGEGMWGRDRCVGGKPASKGRGMIVGGRQANEAEGHRVKHR